MFRLIVITLDIQGKDKVRGKHINICKKKIHDSYIYIKKKKDIEDFHKIDTMLSPTSKIL